MLPVAALLAYAGWVRLVASRPDCDAVVALESRLLHDESLLARELVRAPRGRAPVVMVPFSEDARMDEAALFALAAAGIPVIPSFERAIAALDALPDHSDRDREDDPAREVVSVNRVLGVGPEEVVQLVEAG
jgi:hypothetical protein